MPWWFVQAATLTRSASEGARCYDLASAAGWYSQASEIGFAEKVFVLSRRSKNIVAAKTAGSLDREAILRANEARPAALIGPVVTGAVPFHFIRVEREIPQRDS